MSVAVPSILAMFQDQYSEGNSVADVLSAFASFASQRAANAFQDDISDLGWEWEHLAGRLAHLAESCNL